MEPNSVANLTLALSVTMLSEPDVSGEGSPRSRARSGATELYQCRSLAWLFKKRAVLDAVFGCRKFRMRGTVTCLNNRNRACQLRCDYLGAVTTSLATTSSTELVELLNQVDNSYRSEIREQIDLSFARFDAKLEQRLAEFKLDLKQEFRLEPRLAELKAELIKWMFLFWAGTALGGLLLRQERLGYGDEPDDGSSLIQTLR